MTLRDKIDLFKKLKISSGNHSPSKADILEIDENCINIDACFLSNPYATDIILDRIYGNLKKIDFKELIEPYPPSQSYLLKKISRFEKINIDNAILCNGANQGIEWLMSVLPYKKVILPIPTFSTYYESARKNSEFSFYQLDIENNFDLNVKDFSKAIKRENAELAILINPNNPTGRYLNTDEIDTLVGENKKCNFIIDESFIHFSDDFNNWKKWKDIVIKNNDNVIFLKSMSKDFGLAGVRIGFIETRNECIKEMKERFGTWCTNNLAALIIDLMSEDEFSTEYSRARNEYLDEFKSFQNELKKIDGIRVIKSQGNFVLVHIENKKLSGTDIVGRLLFNHHIYIRTMSDKIGLDDSYLRISARKKNENKEIVNAVRSVINTAI